MEYKEAFDLAKQYFKGDDLAATVFLGKYALKSPKGDIEEPTPEYMHRRLAKEFARIEAKYPNPMSEEEIFGLFKDFKYVVPQGSPMAGIGNPYQVMSLSNCFVEGTKVHTKKGVKNIENVDLGDEVLTHKGRYRKVVQLHKNKLDGRQLFSFKAYRTPEIKVTGNHEFMSISKEQLAWGKVPQFNPIQYLRQGDYIQIPQNLEEVSDRGNLDLFSVFENGFEYGNHSYEAVEKGNGRFQLVTVTKDGKRRAHTNTTPKKLQIDEDFAYFLGLWYGDGCVFGENTKKTRNQRNKKCKVCSKVRGLTFTFGSHETNLTNFVLDYLNRNEISFDKNDNKDNTTQIAIHNGALGYGFEHFFGRRFDGKRLAAFMHSWDRELVASLLRGLVDSDGAITKQGDVRVVMSNPDFIESVYHLARSHNFLVGISSTGKVSRLDFGRNDEFRNGSLKSYNDDRLSASLSNKTNHVIDINGTKFVQILSKQEISDNPAFVYTFGVEEDHSYSVEGLIAKNCFVIENPYDSYGGILKTDQEEAQLMKRRGGVGFDISTIRPKGIHTNNAAKTTDGIAVFMERFSNTCREVAQGGRRGALMLSISVHHPEIETFINIKRSLDKVTGANISVRVSDEFMNAVKANEEYEVRFPVDAGLDDSKYLVRQKIKAADIWNQLIEGAHAAAEPGVLFWDTIKKRSPADIYPNFQTQSTNPCFSGDTLIAVADGRNAVSIRELAEAGMDVPVYSTDPKTGVVEIKIARNPRVTGYNKKLVRVTLDDGSHFDVTPDHKCMLRDGSPILAKDLKRGDSLSAFVKEKVPVKQGGKEYYRIRTNTRNSQKGKIFEHRLIAQFNQPEIWKSKYKEEQKSGWIKGGLVVHHKDYNGLSNNPDNLEIMSFSEHQKFHAEHDNSGENNGRFSGVTNEQVKEHAISLTRSLGRRFSSKEWIEYAAQHNIPQTFSESRSNGFYKTSTELSKACAIELNFEHVDTDPRLVKTLSLMLSQGYSSEIVDNQVMVDKTCETCGDKFSIRHDKREISFCSHACSLIYVNSNQQIAERRTTSRNLRAAKEAEQNKQDQARVFSSLKFSLNREPLMKEWEAKCKMEKIPFRIGKTMKYGFTSWKDVKEAGNNYNHKVVSVEELPGEHTVYNLTVEDYHTVSIFTQHLEKSLLTGVNIFQCGEIVLSPYDSCRLLLLNVLSFINNPFEDNASFDHEKFINVAKRAQRLMDDMVDLEIEAIDQILEKIKNDPEPEDVKKIEVDLWNKIRQACVRGRRTGLGVTAIGDALAALNVRYGSEESVDWVEVFYKTLALGAYTSTVEMAEDRGAFEAFDYELEKNHEFLKQVFYDEMMPKDILVKWAKFGRRNIALTTTAPAGSVSVLTQTTSGIEPAFEVVYTRRRKINPEDAVSRVDFVDALGDKWQEYKVYHHQFKKWMEVTGWENVEDSPYWKARANDVDWEASVDLQAAAQKWVCHAISKTCNLPSDVSVDLVKQVYERAWATGCKGFTIYRDGSRSGVLVTETKSDEKKTSSFDEHHAPKRPAELSCKVMHTTVKGEKWTFFVGVLNDKPYEIMGGLSKLISIPKRVKEGKIVKHNGPSNPVARYDFHYDFEKGPEEETIIRDINKVFENATEAAFTRTLSLAMRHGTPVQYVVEQLLKGSEKDDDLFSFSRAVSRVLKSFIADGTKASEKKCSVCSSTDLIYQEGCVTCKACGNSKCG